MNLVTHDWNGSAIAQLSEATKIAKHDVPAGYVNATQMCQACNKLWADYARLESTKVYWEGLSTSMGIPIDLLVITIATGKNHHRGTWIYPEIAIDLAQWVNVDFRIWANRTLRQIIQQQAAQTAMAPPAVGIVPIAELPLAQQQPVLPASSVEEICSIVDLLFASSQIHENLKLQVKGKAIAKQHPQHTVTIETMLGELSIPIEEGLVRPTVLGEKLAEKTGEKWSAIRINKLLADQGFQIPNPDGKNPAWLPTEKGSQYGQIVLDTAKGHSKTVQSLQWHLSVLETLEIEEVKHD
ncbi:MAG: KilA-N domain-containing protein [Nostoc sp.]|uniref:KilA-N domain-containing protein n=1 Tax=Nostoc sp. TaxID=1180 RepID=UPI002FF63818